MHMTRHTVLSLDIRISVMAISLLFAEIYLLASKSINIGKKFQINKYTHEFMS